jgi:hypothetical protein
VWDEATRRRLLFYLPPYSAMTDDARKRIQALEQFSDWGAALISPWKIWKFVVREIYWRW